MIKTHENACTIKKGPVHATKKKRHTTTVTSSKIKQTVINIVDNARTQHIIHSTS